jgi:hypothetical protein
MDREEGVIDHVMVQHEDGRMIMEFLKKENFQYFHFRIHDIYLLWLKTKIACCQD